ncbi:type IX secretion system membrane protein PorP/SprF [Gillisia sp. Hel1_33_143]|uniref:PorP/SprF family type IX secretion system membrane protein n=1 Tax=Gillisia sp. Hel1_33_143 TaxID=1336796 RepID=UPI001E5B8C7E|nr:type IX secretion system membrane protein PorP/SprF [Gillisia sp. Hel1_33_143]
MKHIYIKALLISCLSTMPFIAAQAQIEAKFSNYFYNLQNVNPASVSSLENTTITGIIRSQWQGIEGAPETQLLSIGIPINNNKMGVGFNILHDEIGPSSYSSVDGLYSYSIRLSEKSNLDFGINLGITLLDVDFTKGNFENEGDLARNNIDNKTYFRTGAGIMYHTYRWYAGLSVPNFFKQDFYDEEISNVIANKLQYNFQTGYLLNLNQNFDFVPSILATVVNGNPITLTVTGNFMYNQKFNFGIGYRYDEALNATIGFQFLSHFQVGYAYDLSLQEFGKYNDGSHELILKYRFGSKSSRPGVLNIF